MSKDFSEELPAEKKSEENLSFTSDISNSQILSTMSIKQADSVSHEDQEDQPQSKNSETRKIEETGGEEIYELLGINKMEPTLSSDKMEIQPDTNVNDNDLDDIIKLSEESSIVKETLNESVSLNKALSVLLLDKPTSKPVKRKSSNKKEMKLNISTSSDDLDVIFTESVTNANSSNETCTRSLRSRTTSLRRMY